MLELLDEAIGLVTALEAKASKAEIIKKYKITREESVYETPRYIIGVQVTKETRAPNNVYQSYHQSMADLYMLNQIDKYKDLI